MIDIVHELAAIHHEVATRSAAGEDIVRVLLTREYPAAAEDVWDAVTDPERIARWFLPISGDLRVGGHFQLEGNAGGEILHCEPPTLLRVTFGGETSVVELRLSPAGADACRLELEHTVPLAMAGGTAGSLYVGPGWDGAVMALGLFVRGVVIDDPVAAGSSPEAQEFSRQSVHAWAAAAAGTATQDEIDAATAAALAHFAPDVARVE